MCDGGDSWIDSDEYRSDYVYDYDIMVRVRVQEFSRMETSGNNPEVAYRRRYGLLSASNIIQAPLSALLEYSGLVRARSNHQEAEGLIHGRVSSLQAQLDQPTTSTPNHGEVSIRIIGAGEHDQHDDREATSTGLVVGQQQGGEVAAPNETAGMASEGQEGDSTIDRGGVGEGISQSVSAGADGEAVDGSTANGRDSSYQRYDIQQAARWIEQVLPFSLLLLVVFIRQHLQGNCFFQLLFTIIAYTLILS